MRPPIYWGLIGQQMIRIGYFSLPVVGLTAFFTGGALALQIYGAATGSARSPSCRTSSCSASRANLGPVIAGLMVAGRVAAAIAAEIGTMRVTEQIDALTTLSTNPIKYLVVPRLIAAVVTLPILVLVGDSIGVFGGYVVATESLGFNGPIYHQEHSRFRHPSRRDVRRDQDGGVRFHHRADGLLQRLSFQRRRARRRCGDDQCGRVVVHPDPGGQLFPHLASCSGTEMAAQGTPKIELRGVKKRFGSKIVLDGIDLKIGPANPWW